MCVCACLWVCVKGKGPPGVARAFSCQLKLAGAACASPNNKLQCLEASYSRPLHTPRRPLSCCAAPRGRCSHFPRAPREMRPMRKNLENHSRRIPVILFRSNEDLWDRPRSGRSLRKTHKQQMGQSIHHLWKRHVSASKKAHAWFQW